MVERKVLTITMLEKREFMMGAYFERSMASLIGFTKNDFFQRQKKIDVHPIRRQRKM